MPILNDFFNAIQKNDISKADELALKMSKEACAKAYKINQNYTPDDVVTQLENTHLIAFEKETWKMDKLNKLLQSISEWEPISSKNDDRKQLAAIQQFTIGIIQEKQITQLKQILKSYYTIIEHDKRNPQTLDSYQLNNINDRLETVKEMFAMLDGTDSSRERLKKFNDNFSSFQNAVREKPIPSDESVIYKLIRTIKSVLHIKHNYGIFKSEPEKLKEKVASIVHKKNEI